ncbi:hypothetical protein Vi05172_g323 [Venturia inaequalis]|nr:hypothetical protein Vi05172_g323 [Venturia inaequalis]
MVPDNFTVAAEGGLLSEELVNSELNKARRSCRTWSKGEGDGDPSVDETSVETPA